MSEGSAAHTRGSRAPAASLAAAAALWGGLYVISAATFEATLLGKREGDAGEADFGRCGHEAFILASAGFSRPGLMSTR